MASGPPLPSQLSPAALALLARRAAAAAPAAPADTGPLSYPQLTQWFFAHLYPHSTVFNLTKILTLTGRLDEAALQQSLDAIVTRQSALRTVFSLIGDEPVQRVLPPRRVEIASHDLRSESPPDRERAAGELLEADASRPFDLAHDQLIRAVLVRLGDSEWRLQLTFHHIAFDGWSMGVFLAEFEFEYRRAVWGAPDDRPLPIPIIETAARQRAQERTPAFEQDRKFWREQLRDVTPLDVPLDHPPAAVPLHRGHQLRYRLDAATWQAVSDVARHHGCTPFVVALAAWATLTARRCNQSCALMGVPIASRTDSAWETLIGNFVNVMPVIVDLAEGATFSTVLGEVHRRSVGAFAHQHFPIQHFAAEIAPNRKSGLATLFPVLFNFRNWPVRLPKNLPDLTVTDVATSPRGSLGPLTLSVTPDTTGASIELEFDPDLLEHDTAVRWLDGYVTMLAAATRTPASPVHLLPVMGDAESRQLATWNATERHRDRTATLSSLVARQVEATPDRIAVSAPGTTWSYRELGAERDRVARLLRERGIGPGAFVGVCMERCAGLIAAMCGIIDAGAAYLPIDASLPGARITTMLEDASARVVLVGPGTPAMEFDDPRWEQLPWDAAGSGAPATAPVRQATASDPAYLLYTSGSTGQPKGVIISHGNIANELQWMVGDYPVDDSDAVLQKSSISFDASVWEIWHPLISGARLVMAPPDAHRDPDALIDVINEHQVTVVQVVPTMMRALLDTNRFDTTRSLRRVFCGGEALTWDVVRAHHRIHQAALINLYGPTEGTINATSWLANEDNTEGPVPIGRPIANMRAHVLDRRHQPVPIGVSGELFIAGDGVARGYLNRPQLTAERFRADPLDGGGMMYATGDEVRFRFDGLLEYLGRGDQQVKLRGHRIELGEIEASLAALAGVRAAAVVMHSGPDGHYRLAAFVEPSTSAAFDVAGARAQLKSTLPDYMVPSSIVTLPALPVTSSGKIDRIALTRTAEQGGMIDGSASGNDTETTTLELALQQIWQRLLGVQRVGLDDDFFDLGGHSLLAARMTRALEDATGHRIPLATLFTASTPRALASKVLQQATQTGPTGFIEVQPGAAGRAPFFMVTGDTIGGGYYCRGLASALDPDQPFFAIQPTDEASLRMATIESMADEYIDEVRRIQPHGPYHFGGYCFGGLVAYEMARRLRAAGEEIALVLLVDSAGPIRHGTLIQRVARVAAMLSSRDRRARLERRLYYVRRARLMLAQAPARRARMIAGVPLRWIARRLHRGGEERVARTPERQEQQFASPILRARLQHLERAHDLYRHARYEDRVDLVRSTAPGWPPEQQLAAWQRVAPNVVLHRGESSHIEIIYRDLPSILREQLERVAAQRRTP